MLAVPQDPLTFSTFSIPGFIGGIAVLLGLEMARSAVEKRGRLHMGRTICNHAFHDRDEVEE